MNLQSEAKLTYYTDDIGLIVQQASAPSIEVVSNDSLSRISKWLYNCKLKFAVGKGDAIPMTDGRVS